MAVVNLQFTRNALKGALDQKLGQANLKLVLNANGGIGNFVETVQFNAPENDGDGAKIVLDPVYFVVPANTIVQSISLYNSVYPSAGSEQYINQEPVTVKEYDYNGTYTVSNLTVYIGG